MNIMQLVNKDTNLSSMEGYMEGFRGGKGREKYFNYIIISNIKLKKIKQMNKKKIILR